MPEDAGALLVRSGLIASDQLRIARQAQVGHGGTIGEHLVLAGFIDDDALTEFYRARLMVPQVTAAQLADIPAWLIAKIPAEMAAEFRCVPVACEPDRHLTLAMADPSITHAVDEISFFTGHYVVRAVATQRQIAACLARYYGQVMPLAEKLAANQARGRMPVFPVPVATGQEPSGPARRREGPMSANGTVSRGPRPQAASGPVRMDDTPPGGLRAPPRGPAVADEAALTDDISSPVPVIIESDRLEHPSRRPYVPPETREPMISFLHEETAPTGPMRMLQPPPPIQPPELQDRAGELDVPTGPIRRVSEPLPPVVISPLLQSDSGRMPTGRARGPAIIDADQDLSGDGPGWRDAWGSAAGLEGETEVEYEMDYLPAEELTLPPPLADQPMPLPPAPEQTPVTQAAPVEAAAPADAAEPQSEPVLQYETSYDELDEVVLLDRPKADRRRHRRTRIGLGIEPSTLSRLTGSPPPGLDGASWPRFVAASVSEPADDAPADGSDQAAPVSAPVAAQDRGAGASAGHAQAPGVVQAAAGAGTGPSRVSSVGSIEEAVAAAQAMFEAADTGPRAQAGPAARDLGASEASQAVPRLVEDESQPADTRPVSPGRGRRRAVIVSHGDELDDPRWGPPGSTIPPQFLGPQPTEVLDSGPSPVPLLSEHLAEEVSDEDIDRVLNDGFETPPAGTSGPSTQPRSRRVVRDADGGQARARESAVDRAVARARSGAGTPSARSTALTPAEVPSGAMTAPPVSGPVMSFQGAEPLTPELVRALEDSSLRLVEILRELDQAYDRNGVVDTLIDHLSESHGRVAFFVVKSGELATWKQRDGAATVERRDGIKLSLDEPSTFQDIVGTRLPFRGPLTDPVSRAFVAAAMGFSSGQMLALPVSVRGRVVGILYGDTEIRSVFEQHLAVVTRAAGVALERILRARKGL